MDNKKLIDYIKKTFKQQEEDYDYLAGTVDRTSSIRDFVIRETDFLDRIYDNERHYGSVTLQQRLWHIINDMYRVVTSPITRRPMVFGNVSQGKYSYTSAPGQTHVQFISRLIFHMVGIKDKVAFVTKLSDVVEDIIRVDGKSVTPQEILFLICIKDRDAIHDIALAIKRIADGDFVTSSDAKDDKDLVSDRKLGLLDNYTVKQRRSFKDKLDPKLANFRIPYSSINRGGEDIIERELSKHLKDEDHTNLMAQIRTETLEKLAKYVSNSRWADANLKKGKQYLVDNFAEFCDSKSLAQLSSFAKVHNTVVADNRHSQSDKKVLKQPLNYYTYLPNDTAFARSNEVKGGRLPIVGEWFRQKKSPSLSTLGDMLVTVNSGDYKKIRHIVMQPNPERSFVWKDIVMLYVNKGVTALEYSYIIKLMEHYMMKFNKELETAALIYGLIKGSGFDRKIVYKWDSIVEGYPKPTTDDEKLILKIILKNINCHNHKSKNPRGNYRVMILEKGVVKKKDEKFIGVGYKDKGTMPDPTRQEVAPPYDDVEAEIMSQIIYMSEVRDRWDDIVDALVA